MEKIVTKRYKVTEAIVKPSEFHYTFGIIMTTLLLILYFVSNKDGYFLLSSILVFIISCFIITKKGKKSFDYDEEEIK